MSPAVASHGIEASHEQLDEPARDVGVRGQRVLDVALAVVRPDLARGSGCTRGAATLLASAEPGHEHEAVEAVVFGATGEHREERVLEQVADRRRGDGMRAVPAAGSA